MSLLRREECEERPQQLQQRRQEAKQKQHSAPKQRILATHQRMERQMSAATMMPTIAGHLYGGQ